MGESRRIDHTSINTIMITLARINNIPLINEYKTTVLIEYKDMTNLLVPGSLVIMLILFVIQRPNNFGL